MSHLNFNITNMINLLCYWGKDEDTYSTECLHESRIQIYRKDESNPKIKWMEYPHDEEKLNSYDSPYKIVISFNCGGWNWKIIRYKQQNYIGGLNLLRYRLYKGKLNYLDVIKFLNNHLYKEDFENDEYKEYIYPFIR